ncbi:MAG TPA: amino acid adenylation domain-containing protein, partial [Pyrinomonadaceae bacterium]|nr:amino acid adenylation domain-containing protein [Pyrinomonadaceae bacterium]
MVRNVDLSFSDQKNRLEEYLCEEREQKFDFDAGTLLRTTLITLTPAKHVLVLTLPVLCADREATISLYKQIVGDYRAVLYGEQIRADVLQYVDFSEWQTERLESEGEEEKLAHEYWRQQMSKITNVRLPGESVRPVAVPAERQILSLQVEAAVASHVWRLAESFGVTPSVVLLAAWQNLLWRLTSETHITVWTAFDGRNHAVLKSTLGHLTKYQPIHCHFTEKDSFKHLVRRVNKSCSEAYKRQQFYAPEGADQSSPRIGFEYTEWPASEEVAGTVFTLSHLYCETDVFKLKLSCIRDGDALRLEFAYMPGSYRHADVQRISTEFVTLLQSALEQAETPIIRLEVLTPQERRQCLIEWNATAVEFETADSIKDVFEEQARQTPDATAVAYRDQQMSYAALNARANQLARYLQSLGVGPEVLVGIYMERSLEMLVGLLGILKAGGAYLPLDPSSPAQRLALMLDNACVPVLLTQWSLVSGLHQSDRRVICLDVESEVIDAQSSSDIDIEVNADNLAYAIYTSGSTGGPKGVMIEQRSVLNLSAALHRAIYSHLPRHLSVSVNAPLIFDASVKQIVQLLHGNTLSIIPDEVRFDTRALLNYVADQNIDVLDCTPSQLRSLLEVRRTGMLHEFPPVVLVGGEAIDTKLWRQMADERNTIFYNVYGPTECTVDTTACRVQKELEVPAIGKPLANVQAYILDTQMQPVPMGVAGELYIGGAGLARGYLNRPELTAEKFLADPFANVRGARLYKSGDRVRRLSSGDIEFLGRIDNQIKVRGHRVELEEIEAVLNEHPAVLESGVVIHSEGEKIARLAAYVVPKRKRAPSLEGHDHYALSDNLIIAHLNRNETEYLYDEIFIKKTYLRHGVRLPSDACVFDVGANIGMFALFVARNYPDARIYAFEPIKAIFDCLHLNAELYGQDVKAFAHGLSDVEKRESFSYYPRYTMMSVQRSYANPTGDKEVIRRFLENRRQNGLMGAETLLANTDELLAERFDEELAECRLRRLSDVIREQDVARIDLLKIDVQRAEVDVLRGIAEDDWIKIKQVVMEVHDESGWANEGRVKEISCMLEARGFRVVAEQDELLRQTDRWNLYAIAKDYAQDNQARSVAKTNWHEDKDKKFPPLVIDELRRYLKKRLPEYMLPSAYSVLRTLPRTRRGKIDRAALSALKDSLRTESNYVAPQNEVERTIASIWQEVLKVRNVSVEEAFFDAGGNSLLLVEI